jgi:hypothetical protein
MWIITILAALQNWPKKKQKNTLHVVMCKYYSSYMVIIYAPSSKQHMEDDDVSK